MKKTWLTLNLRAFAIALCLLATVASADERARVVVCTDMKALDSNRDLDDVASMIRLLVYANEFDIEGLLAGRACGTEDNDGPGVTHPEVIHAIVDQYEKVLPNLSKHADSFPSAQTLRGTIARGAAGDPSQPCWNAASDMLAVGDGKSTDASRLIIKVVDKPDDRPVWVLMWGKAIDLAQALHDVRATRSPQEVKRFIAKLRVYDVWGQCECGGWIAHEFPGIFWIRPREQIKGMSNPPGDTKNIADAWISKNIRNDHGPLGRFYPPRSQQAGNVEGDTPSFFYLLRNGLSDPMHPDWGGWGGRMTSQPIKNVWAIGKPPIDQEWADFHMFDDVPDVDWKPGLNERFALRAPVSRWRNHFQRDFQARMDWCVKSVADSNHPPSPQLNGDKTDDVLFVNAKSGDKVSMSAAGSSDPDGDGLSYRWWQYSDADSFARKISIEGADQTQASFVAPVVETADEIHCVLEVTDDGSPALTRYRRLIVNVE